MTSHWQRMGRRSIILHKSRDICSFERQEGKGRTLLKPQNPKKTKQNKHHLPVQIEPAEFTAVKLSPAVQSTRFPPCRSALLRTDNNLFVHKPFDKQSTILSSWAYHLRDCHLSLRRWFLRAGISCSLLEDRRESRGQGDMVETNIWAFTKYGVSRGFRVSRSPGDFRIAVCSGYPRWISTDFKNPIMLIGLVLPRLWQQKFVISSVSKGTIWPNFSLLFSPQTNT